MQTNRQGFWATPPSQPYNPYYQYGQNNLDPILIVIKNLPKASFKQRTISWLVDFFSIIAVCVILTITEVIIYNNLVSHYSNTGYSNGSYISNEAVYSISLASVMFGLTVLGMLAGIAAYWTFGQNDDGQTLGNQIAGIKFVDSAGNRLNYRTNILRLVIPFVSFLGLLASSVWIVPYIMYLNEISNYPANLYPYPFVSSSEMFGWMLSLIGVSTWLLLAYTWMLFDGTQYQTLYDKAIGIYALPIN
jgi:uncharacterized RDD family membrane protein YckC